MLLEILVIKELPSSTSATANITVAATAAAGATFKVASAAATSPFTVTLDNGAKDFALNVIAEDGTARTVTIKFTTAKSTDNKLTALTYQIGANAATTVTGFDPAHTGAQTYTVSTIPFGTKTVTVTATAAAGATVKNGNNTNTSFTVTLNETTVVPLELTVTSESGVARIVTINFSTVKDNIASVTPPVAPTLTEKLDQAADVIKLLPTKVTITTQGSSVTELALTWALKAGDTFTNVSGNINTFTWTATLPASLDNKDAIALTGNLPVTNALVPETGRKGDISVSAPAYQLGDGSTPTTAGTVTVSSTVKEITFNKATVTTNVNVPVATDLIITLKGTGNYIEKITNAGILTLKNASTTKSTSSIATKAAANTGVKVIDNSGIFTDETGTIVAVIGTKGLEITTLPTNQLNVTATTAQLTVAATSGATFQWKKNGSNVATNGTSATLTVDKANAGSYTCVVKNTAVTLITPPVTVSFKETTTPPAPTMYVVSLPAVTGATFSKGERTSVNEGDNFVFMITLDKDYNLSVPVVKTSRNEDIVPVAGVYTVKNVKEDITVTVTGIIKNVPTGIDDVNNGTRIWASGNTLHIYTEKTEDVYVFNASGILQKQFRTPGGDYTTPMSEGLYIVKIGGYTQKVIIK